MTILVTGAAGFIGMHVCEFLMDATGAPRAFKRLLFFSFMDYFLREGLQLGSPLVLILK